MLSKVTRKALNGQIVIFVQSMSDDKDTATPLYQYEAYLAADDMVEEPKSYQVATAVVVPDMDEEAIRNQGIPTMAIAETSEEMTEDEATPAVAAPEMADEVIPDEAATAMEHSVEVKTTSTQWEDQNNEHSYCQPGLGTWSKKQQLSAATLGEDDCVFYTGLAKRAFRNLVVAHDNLRSEPKRSCLHKRVISTQ
ncbi:hypothetical protein V5799_014405 [Amblyomma americanum]|uniref:Uncharacterized protein n=1 Tax=Amblyomma americanum TaxID=6943 RepID=A0AAQ4E359_AMBAM